MTGLDNRSSVARRIVLLGGVAVLVCLGWLVGAKRGVPFVDTVDYWAISLYKGTSPLTLTGEGIDNPVLTAADVTDIPANFVADPFMVKEGGVWYLFFEILNANTGQGDLGLATSSDGLKWTYKQVVDEAFHLSYPQVFKWEGQYYMIPESYNDRSVRLYKATTFPTKWALVKKLIDGPQFVDSSVLRYNDRWWLFSSTLSNDNLLLYHSESLMGPYVKHTQNPILSGRGDVQRPGGRVIMHKGKPLRFAQDDGVQYGSKVFAFEILELTPTTYRERQVGDGPLFKATGSGWNADGMHHVDAHDQGPNDWIAVVDGYRWKTIFGLKY